MRMPFLRFRKNDPLPKTEIAELINLYANNPDIQMERLGKMFGVRACTAWKYICKYYFGWVYGGKVTIVLQSKINDDSS